MCTEYYNVFSFASDLFASSKHITGSGRTLRETVLESSPVLALLNQSFVSSWSLVKELEDMQVSERPILLSPAQLVGSLIE